MNKRTLFKYLGAALGFLGARKLGAAPTRINPSQIASFVPASLDGTAWEVWRQGGKKELIFVGPHLTVTQLSNPERIELGVDWSKAPVKIPPFLGTPKRLTRDAVTNSYEVGQPFLAHQLFCNGILQELGATEDYTINGTQIIAVSDALKSPNEKVIIYI